MSLDINQDLFMPSDHAPIGIAMDLAVLEYMRMDDMLERATSLGDHAVNHSPTDNHPFRRHSIPYRHIDSGTLRADLEASVPPDPVNDVDVDSENIL